MADLSALEKLPLIEFCRAIKDLRIVYEANEDSFQDTVCKQYNVGTDEQLTFAQFMKVVSMLNEKLPILIEQAKLIENHFLR